MSKNFCDIFLLLLQRLRRVGSGGTADLNEDSGEGYQQCEEYSESIYPPMIVDSIHESFQISSAGKDSDRNSPNT